jgi:hypothetical protein
MAALAIMGSAITVILTLAGALFKTSTQATQSVDRVIEMKNMLIELHENPKATRAVDRGFPSMNIQYQEKHIPEKSVLKDIKNLVIERVNAQWYDKGVQRADSLVFFLYKPEKKEKEGKQDDSKKVQGDTDGTRRDS